MYVDQASVVYIDLRSARVYLMDSLSSDYLYSYKFIPLASKKLAVNMDFMAMDLFAVQSIFTKESAYVLTVINQKNNFKLTNSISPLSILII